MKPANKARRVMLASLLVGSAAVSTGCTSGGMSLASVNPFAKPASPTLGEPSGISAKLASAAGGAGKQVSSVGDSAKTAWSKTSGAIAGIFRTDTDEATEVAANDPLSLSTTPDSIGPEVFVANGQLWESTGDFGKAMESYTKALESEANHAPALTSIARLHFRQGNHKQAAEFFQRAIIESPEDAGLHNDLGLTLNKMGDRSSATSSLQKALELQPGTSRYANNLASVKYESGDINGAYQVLSTSNKPAVANFNMAYLHFKSGKLTQAQHHLNEVMKFEPQASIDPAIQRAVERSKDMLAQISTASGSASGAVAQAAPQATIAAGNPYMNAGKQVQQTSQSGAPTAGVSPASSVAAPASPAAPTSTAPAASAAPAASPAPTAPASAPSLQVPSYGAPKATAAPAPTRPMPTRPMPSAPSSPSSELTPSSDATPPSIPFSLPSGFGSK